MSEKSDSILAEFKLEDQLDLATQKNANKIRCVRCDSLILQPNMCVYIEHEEFTEIPSFLKKKELMTSESSQIHTESINKFWFASDIFTFENIGLTNAANNKKYLICADCEIGPLGYQNIDKPNEYFLCVSRVKYC
jgi:hypothetical protein